MYVETGVVPAQHFLHQREVYKLFAKPKRENSPGEKLCEKSIIEV